MASTPTTWEATAEDRSTWREIVQEGIKRVDVGRNLHAADRRVGGKKQTSTTPTASFIYSHCSKDCHWKLGWSATAGVANACKDPGDLKVEQKHGLSRRRAANVDDNESRPQPGETLLHPLQRRLILPVVCRSEQHTILLLWPNQHFI